MRTILLTGKGGAGKTTLSAASAMAAAATGCRVLVVSTDAAHSLGDVLGAELGPDPRPVDDELDAAHLDGRVELERSWGGIAEYLRELLGWAELDQLHADELLVVPGLDQLLALSRLTDLADSDRWDVLIVDCAPSADSLRLLSLPDVLSWYVERLFGRRGPVGGWVRRRVERSLAVPAPDDHAVGSLSRLADQLARLRARLHAPSTSTRLVLTPERVVVAEARRTLAYLALYGHRIDALLVNRVLPATSTDPAFANWAEEQRRLLDSLDTDFAGITRYCAPHLGAEPSDRAALLELGIRLYGEADPVDVLSRGDTLQIEARGPEAVVRVPAAGIAKRDVSLDLVGPDLVITVGAHRRPVRLPDALSGHEPLRATIVGNHLEVVFAAGEVAGGG